MAIYHCNVQIISRSQGRSATAAAAYRSRSKLRDDRYGKTHDYSKKDGLSHSEILLPIGATDRLKNRQELWNEVEKKETRINSQLAREFVVALPKELTDQQNIALTRKFAREEFVKRGMIANICIHDLGSKNPHAHIMLTMRKADENGLKNEKKSAREWNKKDLLKQQRSAWSDHVNQALEQAKVQTHVDHRSWKDKGIDHEPKIHLGWYAHKLEQQGIESELGTLNRMIENYNAKTKEIRELERKIATENIQKLRKEFSTAQIEERQKEKIDKALSISKSITQQEAAQELKEISNDQKALIKQLLDQQQDRKRGKPHGATTKNSTEQQLSNLNDAITEFSASVEKLKETQQQQKPPEPKPKPIPKRKNQERER